MTVATIGSPNVDGATGISEPAANRLTEPPPGRVIRFTWLAAIGWILALALGATAALLAGTVVGVPAAFRALNAIPAAAWLESQEGTGDELTWLHYC